MDGATITTTVFSDEQGNYYFPAMDPGKYRVWAQADTFETSRGDVDLVTVKRPDFVMKPMKDYFRQLTGDQCGCLYFSPAAPPATALAGADLLPVREAA